MLRLQGRHAMRPYCNYCALFGVFRQFGTARTASADEHGARIVALERTLDDLARNLEAANAVLVLQRSLEHRVLELHGETGRGADAALRGERAAEHGMAGLERIAAHQVFGRAHGAHRPLLVELTIGPRAQDELLPMPLYVAVAPRLR